MNKNVIFISKFKKIFLFLCTICFGSVVMANTINWYVDGDLYTTTSCESGGNVILPAAPTKPGQTFVGWLTYTPLEYLESTGTQWIDTRVVLRDNYIRAVLNIEQYTPYLNCAVFIGSANNNGGNSIHICSNNMQINAGSNMNTQIEKISQYNYAIDYLFDNGLYEVKINNNVYTGGYGGSIVNNDSIFLFAYHERGNASYFAKIRLSEAKIYSSSGLIRDFIPVLDYNDVPCMFDKVTNTFFYNQGSGDFIAGPVVAQ